MSRDTFLHNPLCAYVPRLALCVSRVATGRSS